MGQTATRWGIAIALGGTVPACARPQDGPSSDGSGSDDGGSSTAAATMGSDPTTDTGESDGASTDDSDGETSSSADTTTGDGTSGTRYDQVRQKSTHNAYQRHEAIVDQLLYHRVRSLELDIHVGKTLEPTVPGNWYVYHTDITDDETWCVRLDDCLGELAGFRAAVPEHEIVTLWIDLKDPWGDDHRPAELDARLEAAFGAAIVTPAELRARCDGATDLQTALLDPQCGWPELASVRGRVLVVLTGGTDNLRRYHDDGEARLGLVAPALGDPDDAAAWPHTSVFNFSAAEVTRAGEVAARGHVVRVWDNNDVASWDAALAAAVHHIATDKVSYHQDPWATTHDDDGWPFACLDGCASVGPEPAAVIGIDVDSGDIWASADSGWFVHDDLAGDPDHTWTVLLSTPNSHVEPFAKGCLMAREQLDAGARYFAVCRPADDEPLRVQWRAAPGGDSVAVEDDIVAPNTVDPPAVAFVRLRVTQGGTCVAGDGSRDGVSWVEIGAHCFDAPLPLQGIAAASHDAGSVRLLFAALQRDGVPIDSSRALAASVALEAEPGSATALVFDGVLP